MSFNQTTSTNFNTRIVVTFNENESHTKYIHKKIPPVSKSKNDENSASYINKSFDEYCAECSADDLNN